MRQNAQWEDKTGASINVTSTRVARPGSFGTLGSNGSYVILARKSTGAIGAAKLLKVMAGDRLHTKVESFYTVANANNSGASGINSLVANLASAIGASSQVGAALKDGASSIASGLSGVTALVNLLNTANNTSGGNNAPKAYLNVLFFDEQFKYDASASLVRPIPYGPNVKQPNNLIGGAAVEAKKNGYAYIYVSNESDEMVYFDNFDLTHEAGPIMEETHYYPFGLTMAGISSKALGKLDNKRGFNGNELQNKEFSDGSGLELYDFNARTYDQQIGRFIQVDPLTDEGGQETLSPYHFSYNNPVRYSDPDGKCPTCIVGPILGAAVDYGTQVAGNLIEGKSLTESLTDVDGGSILTSAAIGAVTSGASAVKAVATIGVKANQLSKAQKAVTTVGNAVKKAIDKSNENQNSGTGRGKNNRKPDPEATGDHSVKDKKGNTTYEKNSQNPSGFDEVKRTDVEGKAHTNTDGSKVPTPHVHEKGKKNVRSAKQGEDY